MTLLLVKKGLTDIVFSSKPSLNSEMDPGSNYNTRQSAVRVSKLRYWLPALSCVQLEDVYDVLYNLLNLLPNQ